MADSRTEVFHVIANCHSVSYHTLSDGFAASSPKGRAKRADFFATLSQIANF